MLHHIIFITARA